MSTDYNEIFAREFERLNEQQKEAVIHTEGPVLVIAGPGTGKTQILAARIANIIRQNDNKAEDILCLTYTDAGAVAMRKRLLQFIGPDAYKVEVLTFHAFCNMVIQENLDYFGLRGLDAVSELEQIGFVHQVIDSFPKNHPLKRYTGDVYYETKKLLGLYEQMKRENWTAAFINQQVDLYLEDIKTRDEYIYKKTTKYGKAGELKAKVYEAEVNRMLQLKAAADTFDVYQGLLLENGRYDFADMILWVIAAFKNKPDLLSQYQEKYQYFLVDEFQDTSGAQNEILSLLISYWDSPNVFSVGDDDQSIYRFQGANVTNIRQFVERYGNEGLKAISLSDNYRSTQFILDAAKALISNNPEASRIDPGKTLLAKNTAILAHNKHPELTEYYNLAHEAVGISKQIEALQKSGVKLSEIAVIYRKHAQAEDIIKYLSTKNIAVNTKKRVDILQEPLIKKILQLLRFISAENHKANTGEAFIYEILHYDFFRIPPIEIARISVEVASKNFSERKTTWREEIRNAVRKKPSDLFTQELRQGKELAYASKVLEAWISDGINLTTQQLIERVINESGMLAQALTSVEKRWNMQLLHTFFDFVKNECRRKPRTTLKDLLASIDLMLNQHVSLPAQLISFAEDGVNFITAHGSKGLEFEHVFMMGCTTKAWEKSGSMHQFKLPDNLYSSTPAEDDDSAESRRLFYVAMTRAKHQLHISFSRFDNNGKDLEKSRFVAELETHAQLKTNFVTLPDDALVDFTLHVLNNERKGTEAGLFDNEFVDELLQKYSLSVTHLNNYLKCPTAFYFNNLIRVPAPLSAAMTFGSAVHYALEMLFRNMNAHAEKQFAGADEFMKDFRWYMRRFQDSFTETEYRRRMEYGEEILPKFYSKYIGQWNKITSIERSYRNVVMNGVPLNGKLDKIEFDGNQANVVDYKTGQYERARTKFGPPDEEKKNKAIEEGKEIKFEDEFGGDYWRQAVFYKIIIDHDKNTAWQMQSAEFDFVEPDKATGEYIKHRVYITPSDVEIVKQQIVSTYANIKAKNFSQGCGKEDCEWCDFVNTYYSQPRELRPINVAPQEEEENTTGLV